MQGLPLPFQPVVEQPWAMLRPTLQQVVEHIASGSLTVAALPQQQAPQRRREGAVALIPVHGAIERRQTLMGELFGAASIDTIRASFREAMAAPDVVAVILDIDSPGGGVDGITELATEIRNARGSKPIVAIANGTAASAAYWLAAQADELYVTPSGQVGSVGIYAIHADHSQELADAGITVTILSAGERKLDGHPLVPLDDDSRAELQKRVDHHYDMFIRDVAAGRGVTASAVREGYGKGATLLADEAKAAGMVDGVATLETVIRQVARQTRASTLRADAETPEPRADIPERAERDEPDEVLPFRVRVQNLAEDARLVVAHAATRADLRAREGRPAFHETTVEALRSIRDGIDALIGTDEPDGDAPTEQAVEPPAVQPVAAGPVEVPQAPTPRRFPTADAWDRYVQKGLVQ